MTGETEAADRPGSLGYVVVPCPRCSEPRRVPARHHRLGACWTDCAVRLDRRERRRLKRRERLGWKRGADWTDATPA